MGDFRIWPHHLLIARPGGGTAGEYNEDDEWVPEAGDVPEPVYDGPADVQDQGRKIQHDSEGAPDLQSDAVAFLRDESRIPLIRTGDTCTVTFGDGSTSDARVLRVSRLDGSLDLERL